MLSRCQKHLSKMTERHTPFSHSFETCGNTEKSVVVPLLHFWTPQQWILETKLFDKTRFYWKESRCVWNSPFFIFCSGKYLEDWNEYFLFPFKATTIIVVDNICLGLWLRAEQSVSVCYTLVSSSPTAILPLLWGECPRAKLWRSEILFRTISTNLNMYPGSPATTVVINTMQISYWKETQWAASKQLRSLTLNITCAVWPSTHVPSPLKLWHVQANHLKQPHWQHSLSSHPGNSNFHSWLLIMLLQLKQGRTENIFYLQRESQIKF